MSSKHKNLWLGGVAGFLFGICGNLVAAWIQQDVLNSSFTPLRIGLIVFCSLIGIFITTQIEARKINSSQKEKSSKQNSKNSYSKIKIAWSKLRTRGKDIHMEDISSIGSDIDIDTE